jgi:hypothetical protein
MALTKEQLLKPRRALHPVQLAEFEAPLTLGAPSGLLATRLRALQAKGLSLDTEEALALIVADMVVDENGAPMLSREEAPRFLQGLGRESLTTLLVKFAELSARGADASPSKPSPSDA